MTKQEFDYKPVYGKTYSLFGNTEDTIGYYRTIKQIVDLCLLQWPEKKHLLHLLKKAGRSKGFIFRSRAEKLLTDKIFSIIKNSSENPLSNYTKDVSQHIKKLSLFKRWDKVIALKEWQYHLNMVEAELTNRINNLHFKACEYKIALLPHCLSDFYEKCNAFMGEVDYVCKGCKKECYINRAGKIFKEYNIHSFISIERNHKILFKNLLTKHKSIGILGVACLPELVNGLRLSNSIGLPAIGIPLDTNCCRRWMGKCYENSFNLEQLELLVSR